MNVQGLRQAPRAHSEGFESREDARSRNLADDFEAFLRETGLICSQGSLEKFYQQLGEDE